MLKQWTEPPATPLKIQAAQAKARKLKTQRKNLDLLTLWGSQKLKKAV